MDKIMAILKLAEPIITSPELLGWVVTLIVTALVTVRNSMSQKNQLIFDVAVAAFNRVEKAAERYTGKHKDKVDKLASFIEKATLEYYARTGREPGKAEVTRLIHEAEKLVLKKKLTQ